MLMGGESLLQSKASIEGTDLLGRMKPRMRVLYCTPPTDFGTVWQEHEAAGLLPCILSDLDLARKLGEAGERELVGRKPERA